MEELLKAIALLMGHTNQQEVADLLLQHAQPVAQKLINKGHGLATEQFKDEKKALEKAKTDAEEALNTANSKIKTLESDKPDIAALQTQHTNELAERDRKHEEREEKLKTEVREVLLDRDLEKVRSRLKDKKVDPELARIYTDDNIELKSRIKHDVKRNPTVFQPGTQIPYSVTPGQDALDPVVDELLKKVPKSGFTVDIDEGTESSGHGTQNGGGGGDKGKKGTIFDKVRSDTEAAVKAQRGADVASVRAKKLGGAAPAR